MAVKVAAATRKGRPPKSSEEKRADALERSLKFLYGEVTENDKLAIRSMILLGASDAQITKSVAIAALNQRVVREDKSRYAFGCLRNLMLEDPVAKDQD